MRLEFEELFFFLRKRRKRHFPPKISHLAERVVNFTESEIYLLMKVFAKNLFLKVGGVLNRGRLKFKIIDKLVGRSYLNYSI
jgi:hypothetical protein